jgi:hypothetical protein
MNHKNQDPNTNYVHTVAGVRPDERRPAEKSRMEGGAPVSPAVPAQTATAGMAWSDIAASAYRAYAASTGNKNFRGEPMPDFSALPQSIRTAWEAAVRQAGYCIDSGNPTDESRWAGWLPPGVQAAQTERRPTTADITPEGI